MELEYLSFIDTSPKLHKGFVFSSGLSSDPGWVVGSGTSPRQENAAVNFPAVQKW